VFAPPAFTLGSDVGRPGQATAYDSFGRPLFAVVPYGPDYSGGVRVATGDVNGDGIADVVTGPGLGASSRVIVFDGKTRETVRDTTVFEASFTGGVFLSSADLNGDGQAEVIVSADVGGGPRVVVLDGATGRVLVSFLGIDDDNFRGGARTAVGDFNGDGVPDLVVAAGAGGGPRVAVFDGRSVAAGNPTRIIQDFYAFEETLTDGVFPAAGDLNGDGIADFIFGGGPGGGPRVRIADGATVLSTPSFISLDNLLIGRIANFFAGDPNSRDGARIVARDLDGDNIPELITASGLGGRAVAYVGANIPPQSAPATRFELTPFPDFLGGVYVG
jgi:hypothetical protein